MSEKNMCVREGNTIRIVIGDDVDDTEAERMFTCARGVIDDVFGEDSASYVNLLVDLRNAGEVSLRSSDVGVRLIQHPFLSKVAFFGANFVLRRIISAFVSFSGTQNARLFDTEEEAEAWLHKN